jgi:hypothetical protein
LVDKIEEIENRIEALYAKNNDNEDDVNEEEVNE